jgi:protein-tyrosine-phosphatase
MADIKSVLFVCTGNSCRSVMAEGLLKKLLKALGKTHIEVRSAGIGAVSGMGPTDETMEVMRREDIDVSGHSAKRLTEDMVKGSDLVLVMEEVHKNEILRRVPGAKAKTYLLKEFGLGKDAEKDELTGVPDPICRPMTAYEYSFNVIKSEIERIARLL